MAFNLIAFLIIGSIGFVVLMLYLLFINAKRSIDIWRANKKQAFLARQLHNRDQELVRELKSALLEEVKTKFKAQDHIDN